VRVGTGSGRGGTVLQNERSNRGRLKFVTIVVVALAGIACGGGGSDEAPVEEAAAVEERIVSSDGAIIERGVRVKLALELNVDEEQIYWYPAEQPFGYLPESGQVPAGLERELLGLAVGEERHFVVEPEDGYGPRDPDKVSEVAVGDVDPRQMPEVGTLISGTREDGSPYRGIIQEMSPERVIIDSNHPLAGKTLHYDIRVLEIVSL
jgi:FKBP-type peptidyl-prolyl cis-trans isomerase 2